MPARPFVGTFIWIIGGYYAATVQASLFDGRSEENPAREVYPGVLYMALMTKSRSPETAQCDGVQSQVSFPKSIAREVAGA